MKLPRVFPLTRPTSQPITRMTKIVQSIAGALPRGASTHGPRITPHLEFCNRRAAGNWVESRGKSASSRIRPSIDPLDRRQLRKIYLPVLQFGWTCLAALGDASLSSGGPARNCVTSLDPGYSPVQGTAPATQCFDPCRLLRVHWRWWPISRPLGRRSVQGFAIPPSQRGRHLVRALTELQHCRVRGRRPANLFVGEDEVGQVAVIVGAGG